jgi:TP901 family phage tail tape measure protein/lambda family phage tail tape measure protein
MTNQATANLSVGIKTEKARQDLLELKRWLQTEMRSIAVSIDPSSIDRSIAGYLKQRTFKISVNTKALSQEIQNDVGIALDRAMAKRRDLAWNQDALRGGLKAALEGTFGQRRRVNFDAGTLRGELSQTMATAFADNHKVNIDGVHLRAQVQAALGGANLPVGVSGSAGHPAALGPAVAVAISQALTPAVDELAKAASVIGGAARSGNRAAQAGEARGRVGKSFTGDDGRRFSWSASVDPQEAVHAVDEGLREQMRSKLATESSRETFRARMAARRSEDAAAKAAGAFGPDRSVYDAQIAAERVEKQRFQTELERMLADSSRETLRARRFSWQADQKAQKAMAFGPDRSTLDAQLASERKAQADFQTGMARIQRESSRETFRARRIARAAEEKAQKEAMSFGPDRGVFEQQLAAERTSRDQFNNSLSRILEESSSKTFAARRSARRYEDQRRRQEMQEVLNTARFEASANYTARGAKIAGAKALMDRFGGTDQGRRQVESFINNGALVRSIGDLDKHRKEVEKVTASHVKLSGVMNEAHSAARGLAGSMGQMWLTWGSTVPLVAGAAIGKDLEYQLTFVKGLTGEAMVSINELGGSIKGSLATPLEAASGLRALAQNGLNTSEALRALPTVLNLAAVGEMAVGEAALGATGVMAAFNLEVSDLGRVSDVFAKAAAISNTSVGGMVEAMKQASTVGDSYGVTLEETAAALSVLAKRNIEGSAAGTAFRNMMTELASPTKKARETMKTLGIEVFDANNQLKSMPQMLEALRMGLAGLNQEGRLNALKSIFDERGAKAANAMLSDFAHFGENLDTLKNKAQGFTDSIAGQLQETLEGKLKGTLSDFQRVSTSVFFETSDGLKNLADGLRSFVNSDELKAGLKAIADGFVSLTRFVMENGQTILWTVGGWAAFRAGMVLVPAVLSAVGTGLNAVAGGLAITRVGLLGVAGALTGGLALVTALAAEYLLLGRSTNETREALEQYDRAMQRQVDNSAEHLQKLRDENDVLAVKVRLLKEGRSLKDATEEAEKGRRPEGQDKHLEGIAKLRANIADRTTKITQIDSLTRNGSDRGQAVLNARRDRLEEENKLDLEAIRKAEDNFARDSAKLRRDAADARAAQSEKEIQEERVRLEKRLREYNDSAQLANTSGKAKAKVPLLETETAAALDNQGLKKKLEELEQNKNRTLSGFTAPERKHDPFNQHVTDTLKRIREEQAELKESTNHWAQYNKAKYSTEMYGPAVADEIQRLTAESDIAQVLTQQVSQKAKLQALRSEANGDVEKTRHLDSEIQGLEASNRLLTIKLDHLREISALEAANKRDRDAAAFVKNVTGFQSEVDKQIETTTRSYDVKVQRPEEAAATKASAAVRESARSRELELLGRLELLEQGRVRLARDRDEIEGRLATVTSAAQTDQLLEQLSLNTALLEAQGAGESVLQRQLDQLRAITSERAKQAADNARTQNLRSQTAEYGMEKFWENYTSSAQNAAQQVESVMKTTMDGLGGVVANFATTGKGHFKDFARGVLIEVTKMMASRAMLQFAAMLASMWGGSASGGTAVNGSAGSGYGGSTAAPTTFAANGHVMTSEGPLQLRKYANGGIARTPQLAVYGEGRLPEAYVPLPDGRTIPVTMSGDGGGGQTQVNMTVNVYSDGKSSSESDVSGEKAAELGRMLDQAVTAVIVRERRPGGLLY